MTVKRAETSWGAVDKPSRCQSESSGQAGVGSSESTLTEAASRDHYREVVGFSFLNGVTAR